MTGWTGSSVWTWQPDAADSGNNAIKAEVRCADGEGPEGCDDWDAADYIIKGESIATGPSNWQKALLAIIIIIMLWSFYGSVSRDMSAEEIQLSPGHAGQMTADSTVNQGRSEGLDAGRTASFNRPQPEASGLQPSSVSPKEADSKASRTADENDPEGELFYSFLLRGLSGDEIWKARQDWSTGRARNQARSAADGGEDGIRVQDRREGAPDAKEYDAEMISSYTIAAPQSAPAASMAGPSALMRSSSTPKKTDLPSSSPPITPISSAHLPPEIPSFTSTSIHLAEVFGRQVDGPASFTPQEIAAALDRERLARQRLLLN